MASEGVHDASMWHLMSTVDLLKHGIPDPSAVAFSHPHSSIMSSDKENVNKFLESGDKYIATPIFVHTRLRNQDISPFNNVQMKKTLSRYFHSSSFLRSERQGGSSKDGPSSAIVTGAECDLEDELKLFLIPSMGSSKRQYESYDSVLWKLRDQVLSTNAPPFSRTISERDWLKNCAKIWDLIKSSPIITDYCATLQGSGLYRK